MKLYVCLLVMLVSTCSAIPAVTLSQTDNNPDIGASHMTDVASELDEELLGGEIDPMEVENDDDIDIIPLEDILGLVTPDGEIITDEGFQNELSDIVGTGDYTTGNRRKRWVPFAIGMAVRGYRAYRGWRAARMIKTGTQASPFKPKMRVRQFERPGNFRDAFKTFKSVRPTDVKRFSQNGVRGATGRVGDRTITVRTKSTSGQKSPTVEMFKTNANKADRITDKIRFTD